MSLCHVGQVDELPSATMTLAAEEEAVSFLEKLGAVPEPTTEAADPRGPNKSWAVGQTGCGTNRRWFVLGYSLIFPEPLIIAIKCNKNNETGAELPSGNLT